MLSIDSEYKNVSNLRVLGRKKVREICVLVVMGTSVAQLAKHVTREQKICGSNPGKGKNFFLIFTIIFV